MNLERVIGKSILIQNFEEQRGFGGTHAAGGGVSNGVVGGAVRHKDVMGG